jgi:hypothetical protein
MQRYIETGLLEGDARLLAHELWVSLHGLMTLHVANQLVHGYRCEELIGPMLDRILRPVGATSPKRTKSAYSQSKPQTAATGKRAKSAPSSRRRKSA